VEEVENDPETNEPLYEKVPSICVYIHTHMHEETMSIYLSIYLSIHLHRYVLGRRGGGENRPRDQQTALRKGE